MVGLGFDMHKLKKGRKLVLGGVTIPYPLGLDGHSDADILTHALIDALLGAVGKGDIGKVFGSSDPKYKNAKSTELLKKILSHLKGCKLVNVDATLVAEEPRLSPFIPPMKANLAKILGVNASSINIKSTTAKGLGEIGHKKAMAAMVMVQIKRK